MTSIPPDSVRTRLKSALLRAMKARDTAAVTAYRAAIAAIDNAEAVPLGDDDRAGAIEASRVGAGSAEAERRELTEAHMVAIVRAEIDDARSAADLLAEQDAPGAGRLRDGAQLLEELLEPRATA